MAVVGAGFMGAQIAGWGARSGLEVTVYDADPGRAEAARRQCESHGVEVETARELDQALDGADWIAEAVFEELELKRRVLAEIESEAPADAVISSNSSMIVPSLMSSVLQRPQRFLNVHFLPPVGSIPLVEVIPHPDTAEDAVGAVMRHIESSGLEPVLVRREIPGFIINNVLGALLSAGFLLVEEGAGTPEEIDHVITRGLGHPIGPLRLADYIGLDTVLRASRAHREQTGLLPVSRLVEKMVAEGKLGMKAGEGFYKYS
jgi:3-hydroxyacyl-CoA dehydrogenase